MRRDRSIDFRATKRVNVTETMMMMVMCFRKKPLLKPMNSRKDEPIEKHRKKPNNLKKKSQQNEILAEYPKPAPQGA